MTDTKQPEALKIAKTLDALDMGGCAEFVRNQHSTLMLKEAMLQNKILLLLSSDARIAALEAENRALKELHEAIGAGGVQALRRAAIAQEGSPAVATKEMMRAAVIYLNGADIYGKVPLAALEIEESIYGEVYAAMLAAAPQPVECECEACKPNRMRMILCAKCGNKRCPHATDHRHACTNSNEPEQKGSSYEHAENKSNNLSDID